MCEGEKYICILSHSPAQEYPIFSGIPSWLQKERLSLNTEEVRVSSIQCNTLCSSLATR